MVPTPSFKHIPEYKPMHLRVQAHPLVYIFSYKLTTMPNTHRKCFQFTGYCIHSNEYIAFSTKGSRVVSRSGIATHVELGCEDKAIPCDQQQLWCAYMMILYGVVVSYVSQNKHVLARSLRTSAVRVTSLTGLSQGT